MSERDRIEQALTFDTGCEPSAQEIIDALNRAGYQITPQAGEAEPDACTTPFSNFGELAMPEPTDAWPDYLMIRNTKLNDDLGGLGQRIFTTAGAGYEKRKYIRADLAAPPRPVAAGKAYTFDIEHHGEPGAGILSYSERITIIVESGDPGDGVDEHFEEYCAAWLGDWFDGARVRFVPPDSPGATEEA